MLPGRRFANLDSKHRFAKGKHHGVEELTASSRRCSVGAEGQGAGLAACGSLSLNLGEISKLRKMAARARFRNLDAKERRGASRGTL